MQVVIIDARRHTTASAPAVPIDGLARYDRPPPSLTDYDDLLTGSEIMTTTTSSSEPGTVDAGAQASIGAAARELHLPTVRTEAARLAEIDDRERHTHLRYLAEVLAAEVDDRTERRRARRINDAKPRLKRLADFNIDAVPGIAPATRCHAGDAWYDGREQLCPGAVVTNLWSTTGTAKRWRTYWLLADIMRQRWWWPLRSTRPRGMTNSEMGSACGWRCRLRCTTGLGPNSETTSTGRVSTSLANEHTAVYALRCVGPHCGQT